MLPMSGQQNAQKEQKERVRILRKAGITEADADKIGKAIEKAEREFNIYRQREMAQLESDFDKMVKRLPKGGQNPLLKE